MAKAFIEIDGEGWTLDEYEKFMYGTDAWVTVGDQMHDAFFVHGSGCVIRKTTYDTDFGDGARL